MLKIGGERPSLSGAVPCRPMTPDNQVLSVLLPSGAGPPIQVYVNGEQWAEGTDFSVDVPYLRFQRPLKAQPKLGFGRSVMLAMGIGVYGDLKGDTLDLGYRQGVAVRTIPVDLRRYAAGSPPAA